MVFLTIVVSLLEERHHIHEYQTVFLEDVLHRTRSSNQDTLEHAQSLQPTYYFTITCRHLRHRAPHLPAFAPLPSDAVALASLGLEEDLQDQYKRATSELS